MNQKELSIGIEFGSTRIKATCLDNDNKIIASGEYDWENQYDNGIWTYSMDDAKKGIQTCFANLMNQFKEKYNEDLTTCGAMGLSGMMHGYLVFDKNDKQLSIFKTWRNTITSEASSILTKLFNFNIPQRWSISHIYQSILDNKEEVKDINKAFTLSSYFHYLFTGNFVVGIGEASGMFPIDSKTLDYNQEMLDKFDKLIEGKYPFKIKDILPKVLVAGDNAGLLTKDGALLLDPTGTFKEGVILVPPEGDMGTGMIATNSCRVNTGNASFGTSSNTTFVSDKPIGIHKELDVIVSPSGYPAALVHVNNCTTDINHWESMFEEIIALSGTTLSRGQVFDLMFNKALEGAKDGGGLYSINYYSGEAISGIFEGRPLIVREPDSKLTLANFMRMHMYSILGTVKIGFDILAKEGIKIKKIYGHGGFFKAKEVGQRMLSSALEVPVATLASAGEGGPYGMALLASFYLHRKKDESLEDYLDNNVFNKVESSIVMATKEDIEGFNKWYETYLRLLDVERKAIEAM